jgi:putative flippase GtrA
MIALAKRLSKDTFLRYFGSSACALVVDAGSFFAMVAAGAPAGPASAAGYSLGIVAHWLIASRAVFVGDVAASGPARTRQKVLFVISALAGLAITTGIVTVGAAAGFNLVLTKVVAVGLSFTANWLLRRRLVFRPVAGMA